MSYCLFFAARTVSGLIGPFHSMPLVCEQAAEMGSQSASLFTRVVSLEGLLVSEASIPGPGRLLNNTVSLRRAF